LRTYGRTVEVRTFIAGLWVLGIPVWCAAQTVTIEQLTHRVPAAAAREYRAAYQALNRGDLARSIEHCRKAIESDPQNASAHNDLGALYLEASRPEEALVEFERAVALEPSLIAAHLNTSYAALALGRAQEAEAAARRAIEVAPGNRRAHLLLGWSLVAQWRYSSAALDSLRIAEREFPEARLAAADVLVHQGSLAEARAEVEAYLATGNPEHKPLAEAWLRMLTVD
jgi:Tfp pilus assembly protein PilF